MTEYQKLLQQMGITEKDVRSLNREFNLFRKNDLSSKIGELNLEVIGQYESLVPYKIMTLLKNNIIRNREDFIRIRDSYRKARKSFLAHTTPEIESTVDELQDELADLGVDIPVDVIRSIVFNPKKKEILYNILREIYKYKEEYEAGRMTEFRYASILDELIESTYEELL